MLSYEQLSHKQLEEEYVQQRACFEAFKSRGLKLNIARGIPCPEQIDLSMDMLNVCTEKEDFLDGATDTRCYGIVDGISSAKKFFAQILGVSADNICIGGNSSLNLMYDMMIRTKSFGIGGCEPWCKQEGPLKWICIVPGYDRHFGVSEQMGFEPVPVKMLENGPDMDAIEELIKDPKVKGMWCIPKHSNPDGTIYSPETVERLASLKPAAADFRIYWDNAYCVHDIYDDCEELANVQELAEKAGNPNLVIQFMSTSKMTFPGAGVACIAAGPDDIVAIRKHISVQTIGPDKMNQLRHVRYFKDIDGLKKHMKRHAEFIRPKFEAVLNVFDKEASDLSFVNWSRPRGGYFISLNVMPGTAKRTVELAAEGGVALTPAGSTWPLKKDPEDSNIRVAPTNPGVEEITLAAELLVVSFKLAALEKLLGK